MNNALAALAAALIGAACASSADPPVDAAAVVRRSLEHESLELDPPTLPNYTYIIEDDEKKLDAKGGVKSANVETREVLNLYGAHFERLVRRNGQDLPPEKARAEQARFDKSVEKARQRLERFQAQQTPQKKAALEQAIQKAKANKAMCDEEFLKMFDVRVAASEELSGRGAWKVELHPHSDPHPAAACGGDLKILSKFLIKLWIDREEYRWARFEAVNLAPVSIGKVLIRVPTGDLYFLYEQTRHEDGEWLTSRDRVKGYMKIMLAAPYRVDETETYSRYRKFQAESRILTDEKGK